MAANVTERIPLTSGALCVAMRPAKRRVYCLQKCKPCVVAAGFVATEKAAKRTRNDIHKSYQGVINANAAHDRHATSHSIMSNHMRLLHASVETSTTVTVIDILTHAF